MADPTTYTPGYDFSNYQATSPSAPLPGDKVDTELTGVSAAIGGLVNAVKDVRRADGALKNGIVTADALHPDIVAMLANSITDGALTNAAALAANSAAVAAAAAATAAAGASATAASASATASSGSATASSGSATAASGSASAASASASAAATSASSAPYRLASHAELASRLRYSGAAGSQINVVAANIATVAGIAGAYRVLASGASGADFDYTGTGGVKLQYVMLLDKVPTAAFGALGVATNDTAAVQATIDYCNAGSTAKTMAVTGASLITSSLKIDRPVDGATEKDWFTISGGTLIVSSAIALFSTNLPAVTDPSSQCVQFHNVTFSSTSAALNAAVMDGGKFLRVNFQGCSFINIICLSSSLYVQSYTFGGCNMRGWLNWFFEALGGAYDVHFGHGNLMEQGANGFKMFYSAPNPVLGCSFIGAIIEGLTGTAISIRGGFGITVSGMYFEGNGGPDINLSGGAVPCEGVAITGNSLAPTAGNIATAAYSSIEWGTTKGGSTSGNSCLGRLHRIDAGAQVDIGNDVAVTAIVNSLSTGLVSGEVAGYFVYHNGTNIVKARATLGAADSGGAGFKMLRVPN